jgi:hypothetical protein
MLTATRRSSSADKPVRASAVFRLFGRRRKSPPTLPLYTSRSPRPAPLRRCARGYKLPLTPSPRPGVRVCVREQLQCGRGANPIRPRRAPRPRREVQTPAGTAPTRRIAPTAPPAKVRGGDPGTEQYFPPSRHLPFSAPSTWARAPGGGTEGRLVLDMAATIAHEFSPNGAEKGTPASLQLRIR